MNLYLSNNPRYAIPAIDAGRPDYIDAIRNRAIAYQWLQEFDKAEDDYIRYQQLIQERQGGAVTAAPVVLIGADRLADHAGTVVTIIGPISQSKIPAIHGVDIACDDDHRGQQAAASGLLVRTVVTEDEAAEADRRGLAHRGAGVFYRLTDPITGTVSTAVPISQSQALEP